MTGYHHVEHVMGMAVSIDVHDDVGADRPGLAEVVAWLHHVDATFSTWKEQSPMSRLGRGELGWSDLDDEVRDVLRTCEALRADSGGVFDAFAVPAPNGTTLDPSGYVKGWSVERAAQLLEAAGLRRFAVNAGGDIALRGAPTPDPAWRVGIRDPDDAHRIMAVLELVGPAAVATSATYERGAHIVDPRVGQPTTGVGSATVVGPDLSLADAYATVLFVLEHDGLDWVAGHDGYEAMVIAKDGTMAATGGFAHHLAGDHSASAARNWSMSK